jgi:glycosyltransferase involved in cell wall biosynthesis
MMSSLTPSPQVPSCPSDGLSSSVEWNPNPRAAPLPGISILLPCFHEARALEEAVDCAQSAARRMGVRHEVIVVDDGSEQDTEEHAAHMAAERRGVRLVLQVNGRGYGAAVKSGIATATMPYVLIADPGFEVRYQEFRRFLEQLERADVVVGYRARAACHGMSRFCNWAAHSLYRIPIRDVDCGFKLFPRDLLRGLDLVSNGPLFSTELMAKTVARGVRIAELGVIQDPHTAGRNDGARGAARTARELVVLHRPLRRLVSKKALVEAS